MKKTISYFSAMVLTLAVGQEALAQEAEEGFGESFANFFNPNWKKDFSVTIGTKVWLNEWTRDIFFSNLQQPGASFFLGNTGIVINQFPGETGATQPNTLISDIEPTPIPQIGIRYKRLVVTASYYPETDFDFPISESTITADVSGGFSGRVIDKLTLNETAEREEWDASLGIYVLYPYVVILGGYKEIDQKINDAVTRNITIGNGVIPSSFSISEKIKISGPTIGISGSVPMAHGFGIYANYAHGFMDADITDPGAPTATFDAKYDVAELGFTYNTKEWLPHMPLSAATIYAGYRYQSIETEFEGLPQFLPRSFGNRTDTTKGFAAGINLAW